VKEGNHGNLQALLDFPIESGDAVLKKHFESAPKNATYKSKTIQNELIDLCGQQIRSNIVDRVKECGFFSIMADEVQDSGNHEQLLL